MKNSKFKTRLRLLGLGIFNFTFLILNCPATSVFFPVSEMSGSTNDVTINVKAVNNPVIWNGRFYYQPKLGTNLATVGGYVTNSFIPGIYTVTIAGLNKSWTMGVTNAASELSAVDLSQAITVYSGLISIAGVNLQVVNDGLGNITITDTNSGGSTSFNLSTHTNLTYLGLSASARDQIETNAAWQAFLATNGWTGGGTNGSASGPQTNVANYVTPDTDRAIIRVNASGQAPLLSYGVASDTLVFNRPPVGDGSGLTNLHSTGSSTNLIGGNTNQSVTVSNITAVGAGTIAIHGPVTFDDTISAPEANYASANLSNVTFAGLSNGVAVLQSDGTLGVSTNLSVNISGNSSGATTLLDPELDSWLGCYFRISDEKLYVTRGSLTSQRLIAGPITSPASASFRDGSPMYQDGTYYIAHSLNSFSETNAFGIIKSQNLLTWSNHIIFDCSAASNYFSGQRIKQVWGPKWFTDEDGSKYITVAISTNTTSAGMRAFLTRATDVTLTNWTDLVELTNALANIDNFDGFLIKSNETYQFWTRNSTGGQYIEVFTATNLYGPWTAWKTGNWAGWGNGYEGMWVNRNSAGRWYITLSDGAAGKQYFSTTTGDDFTAWTAPAPRVDSGNFMNGGMVSVLGRALPASEAYLFPNGSNATTGQRFYLGNTPAPSQSYSLYVRGGTSGLLALGGTTDNLLITDPEGVSADFYLARRALNAEILMYNNGANNNLRFDGSLTATNSSVNAGWYSSTNLGPAVSTPPTQMALSQWANPDSGIYFPSINEVAIACNGTVNTLFNADDIYQVSTGMHAWVSSWGGSADIALQRDSAGVLQINSGTLGALRDLKSRTLYPSNIVFTSVGPAQYVLPAANGVSLFSSNAFLYSIHNLAGTYTTNLIKAP